MIGPDGARIPSARCGGSTAPAAATSGTPGMPLAFEIDAEAKLLVLQAGAARPHLPARAARSASSPAGRSRARCSPPTSAIGSCTTCWWRSRSRVFERRFIHDSLRLPAGQGHAGGERPADDLPAPGDRQRPAAGLGAQARRGELLPVDPQGDALRACSLRRIRASRAALADADASSSTTRRRTTASARWSADAPPPGTSGRYPFRRARVSSARTTSAACRSAI